jgi:hydrogenase small subunit
MSVILHQPNIKRSSSMKSLTDLLNEGESSKGASRREFLKYCGFMAAALALPQRYAQEIAQSLAAAPRVPVVWLEFQDCTGDSESFLRAGTRPDILQSGVTDPSITKLLTDILSVEYHETIMAPSGLMAEKSLDDVLKTYSGKFVAVVEGSIPTANNGVACTIAGQTALSKAKLVLPKALAVIALGSCSYDGGLAAAAPNPTGAVGVSQAVPGLKNYIALPGCPANVVNLAATIVYLNTFGRLPERDGSGRPNFAYGREIHEQCERRHFFEDEKFVKAWGDAGHRAGWCLFRMGCRGPATHGNCPTAKWVNSTSWPVASGHGCIGCTGDHFWDKLSPFYTPLKDD